MSLLNATFIRIIYVSWLLPCRAMATAIATAARSRHSLAISYQRPSRPLLGLPRQPFQPDDISLACLRLCFTRKVYFTNPGLPAPFLPSPSRSRCPPNFNHFFLSASLSSPPSPPRGTISSRPSSFCIRGRHAVRCSRRSGLEVDWTPARHSLAGRQAQC